MTAHPALRLLHDVGVATWFGGSLMGATGLNGATALLEDPAERSRASTAGWSRWAPVAAAGVASHVVGAAGSRSPTPRAWQGSRGSPARRRSRPRSPPPASA
jgi:hypothetical protein